MFPAAPRLRDQMHPTYTLTKISDPWNRVKRLNTNKKKLKNRKRFRINVVRYDDMMLMATLITISQKDFCYRYPCINIRFT